MPLVEAVQARRVSLILLPFLRWQDCLSLGAVSTQSFNLVKAWVEERSTDISYGASLYPIPCESACHRREGRSESSRGGWCMGGPLPPSFKYLNESVHLGTSENNGASDLLQGCSCRASMCKEGGEDGSPCPCVQLNASVQSGPAPLFECHAGCSCGAACRLRATQAGGGRKVPRMRVRYMGRKGWGAYSIDALAEGTFVADYTGEALPVEEARKRVSKYDQDGLNYVLTTQEFFQEGKVVWQTIVDATTSGNVSRFFNHSCEPTLSVFVIRRGSFLPRLAFFTLGNLKAGCELTYDYGAVGSAGGAAEGDHEESFESMPKAPRRTPPTDTTIEGSTAKSSSPTQSHTTQHSYHSTAHSDTREAGRHSARGMFASSGDGGGGDDAYNFDIANSYGGGRASKKRSKQSKLGKSSLNKTTGSTPNSSSFKAHEAPSASLMPVPSMGSKAPLRASAPAAPTSALDKAMSFLNKYKEGGSSTPRTNAAEGVGAFRRSGAANTILDEDEMDMSLSSDSDKYLKTTRKSPSRLTASRDNPVPEHYGEDTAVTRTGSGVSRSLTGARSSAQFATARELGILDSGGLEGPKAAVSPAGLDKAKPSTGSKGNTLYGQAGVYPPPPDGRSAGVRAVSATTSASPNAGVPRQGYEYDSEGEVASSIDSVSSMVTAGVEETRGEAGAKEKEPRRTGSFSEIGGSYGSNAQRSSGVVRQSIEQESALLSSRQKDGLCSPIGEASDVESGLSWEGGTGTPRSTMPLDEFASESDHKAPPVLGREAVGSDAGGNRERSAGSSHGFEESEAEDDGEDDYGDDDFEEVDPLLESGGEDAGNQPLNFVASTGRGRSEESEEPGLPQTESHALQRAQIQGTREILLDNDTEHQKPEPATAISSVGASPLEVEVAHGRRHGERQESRQAWSDPPAGLKHGLRDTADFGTSPESDADGDVSEIAPGGKIGTRGHRLGIAEKWDRGSLKGCWMEGVSGAHDSEPTTVTVDGVAQPRPGKDARDETQDISAEKRKTGVTGIGGVSRGGVLIDRSTEVHDSGRPPGMEVKTISRSSGVASVEYAHDTDTGVDLRSYGTQAAGSSAAVQVNIAVPGMLGTESAVDVGHTATSEMRLSGVGYKQGEPYAKWGRFACEMPGNYRSPGGGRAVDGASAEFLSPRATPSRRRSRPLHESCRTGTTGLEGDGVNARESAGGCLEDNDRGEVDQPKGYEGVHSSGPRGAPAYLQTFFAAMAKSQSDNCSAWRKALEETAPARHGFPPPDYGTGCAEAKPPSPGAEGTEPLPFGAEGGTQGRCAGPRDFDQAIYGINTAAQDSFRKQLADLRDNLNKIRYRAEVAGRQGYAHNYESVADVREFIDKVRPRATTQAEALVTVDPSLSLEEAEVIAQNSGTVPSSPVEPHPNRTRTPDRAGDN